MKIRNGVSLVQRNRGKGLPVAPNIMFIENIILNYIYRDSWDNSLYSALGLIISFVYIFWFGASILKNK